MFFCMLFCMLKSPLKLPETVNVQLKKKNEISKNQFKHTWNVNSTS